MCQDVLLRVRECRLADTRPLAASQTEQAGEIFFWHYVFFRIFATSMLRKAMFDVVFITLKNKDKTV